MDIKLETAYAGALAPATPQRSRVSDPDQALVERMAAGDARALRALMDRHLERIVAFARRMLHDVSEAEDVAQEVFFKAWDQAGRWQAGAARYDTWLHRVAYNAAIDRLRRKRGIPLDDIADPVDPAPDAEANLYARQRAAKIEAAIAQLTDGQRAAITLCHTQGLGNIEAAKILNLSVEALESLLTRGRRRLREILAKELAMPGGGQGGAT